MMKIGKQEKTEVDEEKKLKLRRNRGKTRTRGRFLQFILIIVTGVWGTQGKTMHYGLVRRDYKAGSC
jgi:hypothetical protein